MPLEDEFEDDEPPETAAPTAAAAAEHPGPVGGDSLVPAVLVVTMSLGTFGISASVPSTVEQSEVGKLIRYWLGREL